MIRARFGILSVLSIILFAGTLFSQTSRLPEWIQKEKFLRACETADIDAVKGFLKQGISPDTRDVFGQPAIVRAVRGFDVFRNTPEVIRLLLAAGADINAANEFGSTALFGTVTMPETPMNPQALLISSGADVNKKDKYGIAYNERKSYDARAVEGNEFIWRMLLEDEISWSAPWQLIQKLPRHSNSATAMMAASYYGMVLGKASERYRREWQIEVDNNRENYLFYFASRPKIYVEELSSIDRNAANMANKSGETPLIRATKFDNGWLVKKLLLYGADANRRDDDGKIALDYSAEYDYFDSAFLLLARTTPNLVNKTGRTPLMIAAANGSLKALRAYSTAVQFAAAAPKEAAKLRGADRKEMLAIASVFRRIDLNVKDQNGMTALMLAAEGGHTEVVRTLIMLKADTKLTNNTGKTALDIARAKGHTAVVKLFPAQR